MIKLIPNVKKIAVLRANALGDFIFALPALQALRDTYPDAEIAYLGKQWHKEFLQNRPSPINHVIPIPKVAGVGEEKHFQSDPKLLEAFFTEMKKEAFDIAIQLHGGGKYSNPFLLQLGAKLTIGLKTPDAQPLDRWIPYVYYQNEILRYLEVVSLIGAKTVHITPSLSRTQHDTNEALTVFPKATKPFVVLHPGATDLRRQWPSEHFATVGNMLGKQKIPIVITGTAGEKELVDTVLAKMDYPAENLCGKLTLHSLTGILALASLVISNDTGPLHLASSLGTPTVGLYWCGNMINGGQVTRNLHRPVISWVTHCPLCGQDCSSSFPFQPHGKNCIHNTSFIKATPQEVMIAAQELLSQTIQHIR